MKLRFKKDDPVKMRLPNGGYVRGVIDAIDDSDPIRPYRVDGDYCGRDIDWLPEAALEPDEPEQATEEKPFEWRFKEGDRCRVISTAATMRRYGSHGFAIGAEGVVNSRVSEYHEGYYSCTGIDGVPWPIHQDDLELISPAPIEVEAPEGYEFDVDNSDLSAKKVVLSVKEEDRSVEIGDLRIAFDGRSVFFYTVANNANRVIFISKTRTSKNRLRLSDTFDWLLETEGGSTYLKPLRKRS